MNEDAERFRSRARDCRRLADDAREEEWRRTLSEMATELDGEADRLDDEDAARPNDA
jgi:hypothetical protein